MEFVLEEGKKHHRECSTLVLVSSLYYLQFHWFVHNFFLVVILRINQFCRLWFSFLILFLFVGNYLGDKSAGFISRKCRTVSSWFVGSIIKRSGKNRVFGWSIYSSLCWKWPVWSSSSRRTCSSPWRFCFSS